jgi:glutathione S-transferase
MKLYWSPRTRASRVVWMLEEVGLSYQLVQVDIWDEAAPGRTGLQEVSPLGKVPALEDGAARVAESAAIALYVADRYAAGRLAPGVDSPARGGFLYWMFFGPAVMEPATVAFMRMFGMLPDSPPLHAYADLCQARPAYQKAMALNA